VNIVRIRPSVSTPAMSIVLQFRGSPSSNNDNNINTVRYFSILGQALRSANYYGHMQLLFANSYFARYSQSRRDK